jgi:hypothetical protein
VDSTVKYVAEKVSWSCHMIWTPCITDVFRFNRMNHMYSSVQHCTRIIYRFKTKWNSVIHPRVVCTMKCMLFIGWLQPIYVWVLFPLFLQRRSPVQQFRFVHIVTSLCSYSRSILSFSSVSSFRCRYNFVFVFWGQVLESKEDAVIIKGGISSPITPQIAVNLHKLPRFLI